MNEESKTNNWRNNSGRSLDCWSRVPEVELSNLKISNEENVSEVSINEIVDLKIVPMTEIDLKLKTRTPKLDDTEVCDDWVPKCGRHNENGFQQSITNLDPSLHESQFAEWPNMCFISIKHEHEESFFHVFAGGASLISPRFLLTAAHKVKDKSKVFHVRLEHI